MADYDSTPSPVSGKISKSSRNATRGGMQESASRKVVDNLCIIFDLKDFGLNSMDYPLIKNLIWLLSKHYPERLGICLILNSPTIFSGCWLNEVTAKKVVFIGSQDDLVKYVHPDILPNL
ncbi:hypothetical protein HPB52_005581 [Rhipicephalus sanguineus]|uniref:CRAL-TRIO domain-containing protein n=1 Tax=Rhipicephalus sanguineus TaxID=34632 RepID=A0A9D4Q5P2_RHISA|nr:hypothetical protein HPB52_005581 [Rhipicephalus sanguineus]